MKAVRIAGSLPKPLGAPPGWTEENGHCGGLFIRPEVINGVTFMRSAWEATNEEAAWLLAGASMILGVSGNRHPVVHMVVQAVEDFEPVVTARSIPIGNGGIGVHVEMLFAHGGGMKGITDVPLEGLSFAAAVGVGVDRIVELARSSGWVAPGWGA